jgi:hypothetical protein
MPDECPWPNCDGALLGKNGLYVCGACHSWFKQSPADETAEQRMETIDFDLNGSRLVSSVDIGRARDAHVEKLQRRDETQPEIVDPLTRAE